jgi:hypothetical protein
MGQGNRAADAQKATRLLLHLRNGSISCFGLVTHGLAMAQEYLSGRSQRQATRRALQQAHTDFCLQAAKTSRYARWRHTQVSGGSTEPAALHHFGKQHHVI